MPKMAMTIEFRVSLLAGLVSAFFTATCPQALALEACPAPPPAVTSLDLTRFYADQEGSVVDPALAAQHKAETAPLTNFVREVAKQADKSLRGSKLQDGLAAGHCGLEWLAAWARSGALLGRMATKQAEYERKWDMTGLALAYLKMRSLASADQRAAIEPWLVKLADASRDFFDDPSHRRNNHWYWLGLGLGAVGLGADSPRHWQMARDILRDACREIAPDGSLPQEMARGQRALHYHAFALMPLIALAELMNSRGDKAYELENGALLRLASLTARGINDPTIFDRLAGTPQERPVKPSAGWGPLLQRQGLWRETQQPAMPNGHRWLGGDVLLLVVALDRLRH